MKAILKKMDLIVNLKGFAAVLLGVGVLVSSQGAWGQNDDEGPSDKAMKARIQVNIDKSANPNNLMNNMHSVPLPGDAPPPKGKDSAGGGSDKNESTQDPGKSTHKNVNIVLPPLKGFRQLADAAPIQQMYKELINKSVPVLVQTMMMVENGAATGFIGSMNMVSNLMNNTIQTQQFQLELMNITDDTGQMKYAYAGAIKKAFDNKIIESWPAALYVANGDSATGDKIGTFTELKPNKKPFTSDDNPNAKSKGATPAPDAKDEKSFVEEILLPEEKIDTTDEAGFPAAQDRNEQIKELRKDVLENVGNLKIVSKADDKDGIARIVTITYVEPTKKENNQSGLSRIAGHETKKVWENLNELMHQLCKFKQGNENNGLEPIAKKTASTGAGWTPEMWKDASAPDIEIKQNILEQIFLVSRLSTDLSELKCDTEFPSGKGLEVPFLDKFAPADEKNPDLCIKKGEKVTPCLRFKALYNMASIIGNSRTLHRYELLMAKTDKYAMDPMMERMLTQLFDRILGDDEIGVFIDKNRDRWAELILYMARYMQGQQGSGGTFKPGGSNAVGISPGADRQGK